MEKYMAKRKTMYTIKEQKTNRQYQGKMEGELRNFMKYTLDFYLKFFNYCNI